MLNSLGRVPMWGPNFVSFAMLQRDGRNSHCFPSPRSELLITPPEENTNQGHDNTGFGAIANKLVDLNSRPAAIVGQETWNV